MTSIKLSDLPLPKTLKPVEAGILAFVLGPFVLSCLYSLSIKYNLSGINYRGLFQFYSATLGDFVILPFTWYLISKYYQALKLYGIQFEQSYVYIISSYGIGIISTVAVTLAGVYGINRDWTLPEFGTINFSGIYHSLFMMLMTGTFWNFLFDHWKIVFTNKEKHSYALEHLQNATSIYWKVLNLLTIFFVLLWADNIYSTERTIGTFFSSNKFQQISLLFFILINIFFSIQKNLIIGNKVSIWALKQILIIFFSVAFGLILTSVSIIYG